MSDLTPEHRAAVLTAAENLEGVDLTIASAQRASWGTYGEVPRRDLAAIDADLLDLAERMSALGTALADALRS